MRHVILSFALLLSAPAYTQLCPEEIYPSNKLQILAEQLEKTRFAPGETVPLCFVLQNQVSQVLDVNVDVLAPNGWAVLPEHHYTCKLSAQGTHVGVVAIEIPPTCFPGVYEIVFYSEKNSLNEKVATTVLIEVQERIEINIDLLEAPSIHASGEMFELVFSCKNLGNVELPVRFQFDFLEQIRCISELEEFVIAPNANETYPFSFESNPDICGEQLIFLKAYNQLNGELLFEKPVLIDFIPRAFAEVDPYVRIPSNATFYVAGQRSQAAVIAELSGMGNLDEDSTLRYMFRLPSDMRNTNYNLYQQFYVHYDRPDFGLTVGDTIYAFSPLSQGSRYARGVGTRFQPNSSWDVGGFYAQNVFKNSYSLKEHGLYILHALNPELSISANYVGRNLEGCHKGALVGGVLNWFKDPSQKFELEYSMDASQRSSNQAVHADWKAKFDEHFVFAEKIYAGKHFNGYFKHIDLTTCGFDVSLNPHPARLGLSTSLYRQTLKNCEDSGSIRPIHDQVDGQLLYLLPEGNSFSLNTLFLYAKDRSYNGNYHFAQKWLGASYFWNRPNQNLLLQASFGHQKNYIQGQDRSFIQRYAFNYNRFLSANLRANLLGEIGNTQYYEARPWRIAYGGSMQYFFNAVSYFQTLFYTSKNNPSKDRFYHGSFQLNTLVNRRYNVYLETQYFGFTKKTYPNELRYLLALSMPLYIPVQKRKDFGAICGTVYNPLNQQPISDAIVRIDQQRMLTDSQGRFKFPYVAPGEYLVNTELLPTKFVNSRSSPSYVTVAGGESAEMDVEVVISSRLTGDVVLYDYEESLPQEERAGKLPLYYCNGNVFYQPKLVAKRGISQAYVILTEVNGSQVLTSLCNSQGKFYFNFLKPDVWNVTVKILDEEISRGDYTINPPESAFDLSEKEEDSCHFKVIPHLQKL